MKTRLLFLFLFLLISTFSILAQVETVQPQSIAQKFLELYFKGDWFDACSKYSTSDCENQLSFMIKTMETDDRYVDEGTCSFVIDSCAIGKDGLTAICYYTKTCTELKKAKKNKLHLKLIDNKWVVEYIWRRDKYL
jgi:hypothetical protein